MISITASIKLSKTRADGSINIKIIIRSAGSQAAIATKYHVDSPSQFVGGRVVRHPNAKFINTKLTALLNQYDEIVDGYEDAGLSAAEVKALILKRTSTSTMLVEYGRQMAERFKSEGRDSYAQGMSLTQNLTECFGELPMERMNPGAIKQFEKYLYDHGQSSTTVNSRMTHLKALLNAAVNDGVVEFKVFPFRTYRMPAKNIRDICISKEEFCRLRDFDPSAIVRPRCATKDCNRRLTVARDLFLLSFYCAGINLTDLLDADVESDVLTFVRKKTADKKQGEKRVSITIQPEARAIIDRYLGADGRMQFGYNFKDYAQFRSFVTKSLNTIGQLLNFEKKLMFYSARKTFCGMARTEIKNN